MQCLPGDVAVCDEFGWENRAHGTVFPLYKAHICVIEAMQLPRASDGVHEQAERDADSIEHCSLAATIFSHEHGELRMQCNCALRKAPKVTQTQTIHAQSGRSVHLFSARSRSALISKLIDATPHPGSASKGLLR